MRQDLPFALLDWISAMAPNLSTTPSIGIAWLKRLLLPVLALTKRIDQAHVEQKNWSGGAPYPSDMTALEGSEGTGITTARFYD